MSKEQKLIDRINQEMERSAIYLLQYTDSLKPVQNIMVAQGILAGMLSDVLGYEVSKGISTKSKAAKDRILNLMEIVEGFSVMADQAKQARISLTAQLNKIVDLENENEVLKKELEGIKKAWEQTV